MNELPAFFQAYASGDSATLNRFAVRGVSLTGLGSVTFDSINALRVPLERRSSSGYLTGALGGATKSQPSAVSHEALGLTGNNVEFRFNV